MGFRRSLVRIQSPRHAAEVLNSLEFRTSLLFRPTLTTRRLLQRSLQSSQAQPSGRYKSPRAARRTLQLAAPSPELEDLAMPRKRKHPEPFFRRNDSWWYVQIGKDQIKLARGEDNQDEAWR